MKAFRAKTEILPEVQRQLWPELAPSARLGFVLYGGTAIALHLGHRQSVDFDFFTDKPLNKDEIKKAFSFYRNSTVIQDKVNALTLRVRTDKETVAVSFFGEISFGRVEDPLLTSDGILQVASLGDLFALKLKVIHQRAEKKDYIDIAALITSGQSLGKAIATAEVMFHPDFQPTIALKALTFFDDGELQSLPQDTKKLLIDSALKVRVLPHLQIKDKSLAITTPAKTNPLNVVKNLGHRPPEAPPKDHGEMEL
jgi:hypothetical protein